MALNRDQILGALDLKSESVDVPEWGGEVLVSVMSGAARDALMATLATPQSSSRFQAIMIASTVVDEASKPIFSADDLEALSGKNPDVMARVVSVAMRLNGIGQKAVAEAEKNSDAAPNA
jgi:phage terminase large subunit-like protein